jgi:RHS repeat-associated protein
MIRFLFLLCCLISQFYLHSEEKEEANSYHIDLKGMPSSIIDGCVNTITGNYSESHLDLLVPGAHPLPLITSYSSSTENHGTLMGGWDYSLRGELTQREGVFSRRSTVTDGLSQYVFTGDVESPNNHLEKSFLKYGVTNAHSGRLTARENLKNVKMSKQKHLPLKVYLNDHERLEFGNPRLHFLYDNECELDLLTHYFPNRCQYKYEYSKKGSLTGVSSFGSNKSLLGSFKINGYTITTDDERSVTYKSTVIGKYDTCLTEVISPHVPYRSYKYGSKGKDVTPKLIESHLPDSRYTNIQYYWKGEYDLWGKKIKIKGPDSDDGRFGRVAYLMKPTGTDSSPVQAYTFMYHLSKKKSSDVSSKGYTEVFDAIGNRTVYCFDKEQRLYRIEYFLDNNQLYRKENITWGTKDKDYTLLKKRNIEDANGKIWLERTYEYDKLGNAIREKIKGDLTGQNSSDISEKTYTYTDANQIKTEREGKKVTKYSYFPKCDLIKSKLILDDTQIKQRVFFEYDENGALVLEIIDDGNQDSQDNLSGVTQRLIRKIKNTQTIPVGLPEIVTELAYDVITGSEVFLRRTVNHYASNGNILQQDIYDNNELLALSKSWTYTPMGKVASETDPLGQITIYDYDANGNCIYKKIANLDFHVSFVYDYSNRLIREDEVYDDGLCLSRTYSYDTRGNKILSTDIYGNITRYNYDALNRLIEVVHPAIIDVDGDPVNPVERYTYDVLNNITSKTDGNGHTTNFAFTSLGKPYLIQYPDGTEERCIFNTDGTMQKMVLPDNSYILYQYDYQQRQTSEEYYAADGTFIARETRKYNSNHLISLTDKKGVTTDFTYDLFGRLVCAKTGRMETRFVYDSLGRKSEVWEKYADGRYKKTITELDLLNREIEVRIEDELGNIFSKKAYVYDANGNKTHETIFSSTGETTKITEYNGQNEAIKITDPNGETTYLNHNYHYFNEWGQAVACVESVDPNGNFIKNVYSTQGKLALEEYYSPCGQLVKRFSYRYDFAENLVRRIEDVIVDDKVEDEILTTLEYDSRNREIATIMAYGRPEQKIFRKELNRFDKISRQIKPDGVVIDYTYDTFGRLIEVVDSANTVHYVYTYDLNDNVLSVTDLISKTTTNREFDENDLLVKECLDNGFELKYEHDLCGRIEKLTLPDHSSILYQYDARNLKSISRGNYVQTYEYDLSGKPTRINLPNDNGAITYQYDKALRLVRADSHYFSQTIPENGYDGNNNILAIDQTDSQGNVSSNYEYDSLNQLISENGIANHVYSYDSRHNRTQKDETVYENDVLNQLLRQGNTIYGYDANGNRLSNSDYKYEYDSLDRLISVTSGSAQVKYKYDAFNRRMSKTGYTLVNNAWEKVSEEKYLYTAETEIGAASADGKLRELMIAAGTCPAILEVDNEVYLPIHDHRGNVVTLINADTRKVVETYRYSSFGEEVIFDSNGAKKTSALSPWRFSGKRVDPETGWVYFGRRFYDPEVGRWTTPDPLWFEDGPNLYSYVQNNPLIFIDPNGLSHKAVAAVDYTKGEGHTYFRHFEKIAGIIRCLLVIPLLYTNLSEYESTDYYHEEPEGHKIPGIVLIHINGILNTSTGAHDSVELISKETGGCRVDWVHNCTHGLLLDLVECAMGLCRIDTDPVKMLQDKWNKQFDELGDDGIIIVDCHSQGCIHVRNALEGYDPIKRKRIHVIATAPGGYISPEICGSVVHFVSKWDIVPWIDYWGRKANKDTIVVLDRHKEAPIWDHFYNSKTYEEPRSLYRNKLIEKYRRK